MLSNQQDNQNQQKITIDYVLSLEKSPDKFLCPLSANKYQIVFQEFKIRDVESGDVFFEIKRDPEDDIIDAIPENLDPEEEFQIRSVKYHFGPSFFQLKHIGTQLGFSVGNQEVKSMILIERHYFKNQLIQSYKFNFPYCIPNSKNNTWEAIYDIPKFSQEQIEDMINSPWETVSDSYYFVDNQLIIHNKSQYSYAYDE